MPEKTRDTARNLERSGPERRRRLRHERTQGPRPVVTPPVSSRPWLWAPVGPTRWRRRSSTGPSTCSCTSSCARRSTSTRSAWSTSSTPTWPSWPAWSTATSTSPPSSCSSPPPWSSSSPAACCPLDDDVDLDDELALWEERDLLLSRLLECKTFKDAAVVLRRLHRDGARSYPRLAGLEERFVDLAPDLLAGVERRRPAPGLRQGAAPAPQPRGRPLPRGRHQGQRRRRHRGAGRRAAPRWVGPRSGRSPAPWWSASRSWCASWRILELFKAGLRRARPGAATFGDIHVVWIGDADDSATRAEVLESIDVYEG